VKAVSISRIEDGRGDPSDQGECANASASPETYSGQFRTLYQHGTPEVPQGRAFAIMNPFRNHRPEEVAEKLISDLRTNRCERILCDLHSDDSRICSTMRQNTSARLIWRKDESTAPELVYHLPESKANLWITSHLDPEVGFIVDGVSMVR
jgi:hypothetical protein